MGIFSFFRREKKEAELIKSAPYFAGGGGVLNYILGDYNGLSAGQALQFYRSAASIATAIDIIADEIEAIDIVLRDENGRIVPNSPVIDLLKSPNSAESATFFMGQLARYWLLTHNVPVLAVGNTTKEPLELWILDPSKIVIQFSYSNNNYPDNYSILNGLGQGIYAREENPRLGLRYYNNNLRELMMIQGFSSRSNGTPDSPLEAALLEARQQILGRQHNLKMLQNGARPSMMAIFKDTMSQVQHDERSERLRQEVTGATNAGRMVIVSASDLELKEMSINNKDMDYANLDLMASQAIFLRYKIPLPLVSLDASTFNNMEQAVYHLYDRTVLPNFLRIMDNLGRLLLPRFGIDYKKMKLSYNPESIASLQSRRLNELQVRKEIGVETINELRTGIPGREPLEGGDQLYQPASLVPIANDLFTEDEPQPID